MPRTSARPDAGGGGLHDADADQRKYRPAVDTLFLRRASGGRKSRYKAACQLFNHGLKLVYFGLLIEQPGSVDPWFLGIAIAASMIGTSLGKLLLERLSDVQFRAWSNRIITVLATYYVGYGLALLTNLA
jgi:hypothetical protein